MRMQTLREQGLGAKAIVKAYPEKQWKLDTVKRICRRIDVTISAVDWRAGSGRPKTVRTAAKIDDVSELICADIFSSQCPVSTVFPDMPWRWLPHQGPAHATSASSSCRPLKSFPCWTRCQMNTWEKNRLLNVWLLTSIVTSVLTPVAVL